MNDRAFRLIPLFFISLTSLYIAGLVVDTFEINTVQYFSSLVGLAWLFPPMVPTLWFCSVLVFYTVVSGLTFLAFNHTVRQVIICAIFVGMICVSVWENIDERVMLYYPAFFIGAFLPENHSSAEENEAKRLHSIILFICMLIVAPVAVICYHIIYTDAFIAVRIVLDFICVGAIVFISKLLERIISGQKRFSVLIRDAANATFCVYLFHRQFYEVAVIVFGKLNRALGWILVVALFIGSYYIQQAYNWMSVRIFKKGKIVN